MKATILTLLLLFIHTATTLAQLDLRLVFDNKINEDVITNEDVMEANPHLFADSPFYGNKKFSFEYNRREMSSDTAVSKEYVPKGSFSFDLSFHEEKGIYQIVLYETRSQSLKKRLITFGSLRIEDEKYLFTDKMNGFCMTAELYHLLGIGNILLFNDGKSYPHFKRKAFQQTAPFYGEFANRQADPEYLSSILQADGIKLPIRRQTAESYQSEDCDLFLLLNKDTSYRYYVCGLLLSEGTWEQKGQRIDLHDKHLQHTFHGKVTDQGILSGYLPGDMEGTMLRRVEE